MSRKNNNNRKAGAVGADVRKAEEKTRRQNPRISTNRVYSMSLIGP